MKKPCLITLCSSGGAAFIEMAKAFKEDINFLLVSDRECAAELAATDLGIPLKRIVEASNEVLSTQLLTFAQKEKATALIAFYSRFLTKPLIDSFPCFNVHPSLLPKYPGMSAEKKAFENQDLEIGVTLHQIDSGMDTGRILFQNSLPVTDRAHLSSYKRASYISKVKVGFLFCEELIANGTHALLSKQKLSSEFKTSRAKDAFEKFLGAL